MPHMQAACCGATVVVFVMTQDFLMREWCMRELQWALQQRQRSGSRMLPELLPVFLPCGLVAEDRFDVDDLFGDSSMAMLKLSTPDDASEDVSKEWMATCKGNLASLVNLGALRSDKYGFGCVHICFTDQRAAALAFQCLQRTWHYCPGIWARHRQINGHVCATDNRVPGLQWLRDVCCVICGFELVD